MKKLILILSVVALSASAFPFKAPGAPSAPAPEPIFIAVAH
jgi:hypothetical protein